MADLIETPLPDQTSRTYDADVATYYAGAGSPVLAYKNGWDDFVKSLKLNGLWAYIEQLYPNVNVPNRGKNLKNLAEATTYSSGAFSPTSYLVNATQTATLPRQLGTVDANDYCLFAYNSGRHTTLGYTQNVLLGRNDGTRRVAIEQTVKTARFAYGSGTLEMHPESYVAVMYNTGCYVANVKSGAASLQVAGYRQSVAVASNVLPSGQLNVGTDTVTGSADYLTLPFFGVGKGLPDNALNLFNTLCNRLAKTLGERNDDLLYFRGDSITGDNVNPGAMGSLPSNTDVYASWPGRVLKLFFPDKTVGIGPTNAGMITGVPGMRVQTGLGGDTSKDYYYLVFNNPGSNYDGVVPYNDQLRYQFFAFGTNDIYLDPTNAANTPAHFKGQYIEILQRNQRLGWPLGALKVQSNYVLDAARLGPTIAAREVSYFTAMQQLCQELSIQFLDVRSVLQANGDIARNVYSVDGVHLTPIAHQDVAQADYAQLLAYGTTPAPATVVFRLGRRLV